MSRLRLGLAQDVKEEGIGWHGWAPTLDALCKALLRFSQVFEWQQALQYGHTKPERAAASARH